jgi:hypothetical protein
MALPNIVLDDRSFDQLFAFMRRQIDVKLHTDHNYSDPGIALLDLMCWIGESIIYRADRVPDAHIDKFANLILDSPEPVTIPLTLTATLDQARTDALTVKPGTRFATDFIPGSGTTPTRRFVFETLAPVTFQAPPPIEQSISVTAREYLAVSGQKLGTSNGQPDQTYALVPVHADIGLPAGVPTPVLLDFGHISQDYNPNPRVLVDDEPWELKQSLLTEDSRTELNPGARHFTVDASTGTIRFGDGLFGLIPAAGAKIVCSYQIVQGPIALRLPPTALNRLSAIPDLRNGEKIVVERGDAEGGRFFFSADTRLPEGLKRFRRPYRLITASDFEQVMRNDFNDYQDLSRPLDPAVPVEKVMRVAALMNYSAQARQPSSPGCVTLLLLVRKDRNPDAVSADPTASNVEDSDPDVVLTDPTVPNADKQSLIALRPEFKAKIERFLDQRRLITTRIFVQAPTLTLLSIRADVRVNSDRNIDDMRQIVISRIRAFLRVGAGGFDGKGWPLGGGVYRSKLYRLIEDIDGVDHVQALSLAPADGSGDVAVSPLSLPAISKDGLTISVARMSDIR